jgi:hypothetical protein
LLPRASASSPQQLQQRRSARKTSQAQKISSRKRSRGGIALDYGMRASPSMSAVKKAKATAGDTVVNAVAVTVGK